MPRVGEFCPSNILRLLLGVVIIVTLLAAIGFWLYQAPGHGTSIEQSTHAPEPAKMMTSWLSRSASTRHESSVQYPATRPRPLGVRRRASLGFT
jgi:hypothetical protein